MTDHQNPIPGTPTTDVEITHPHTCIRVDDTRITIQPERDAVVIPCVAIEAEHLPADGRQTSVWLTTDQADDLEHVLSAGQFKAVYGDHTGDTLVVSGPVDEQAVFEVTRAAEEEDQELVAVRVTLPMVHLAEVRAAIRGAAAAARKEAEIVEREAPGIRDLMGLSVPATDPASTAAPGGPGKVIKTARHGHDHWSWACPKEDGGCGYQTPWHMRTEAAAQQALEEHLEKCRAAYEEPVNPAMRADSATSD
ncbi:hypothetical protein [Streptomyces sp. NPDC001282]|uniref:hypothetical protein n=1 Tax=Streptomyces sp. NPDC001282 TaxID=3364557 RepID=UPI0036B38E82